MLTQWITTKAKTAPVIRRVFQVDQLGDGKLTICGLGFFECTINGKPVSEDLHNPVWSDYQPRENRRILYPIHDTFTHRVYYRVYDVTSLL